MNRRETDASDVSWLDPFTVESHIVIGGKRVRKLSGHAAFYLAVLALTGLAAWCAR